MNKPAEAQRLLARDKAIFLVTVGEDGRPEARAMAAALNQGLKTIWMMTGKCSHKYQQLLKNQECMIYATDMDDTEGYQELRLWGRIELLDDPETRARVWHDDYAAYFAAGQNDPNLVVLKFTATDGWLQTLEGKEKLSLETNVSEYNETIVELPPRHLVGRKVRTTMAKAPVDCSALWQDFGAGFDSLGLKDVRGSFGVSVMLDAENFDYWAAVEFDPARPVPEGLESFDLPGGLYARAEVPNLEKLGPGYMYLYEQWPKKQPDYAVNFQGASFELYPTNWQPTGPLEIFMPLVKK